MGGLFVVWLLVLAVTFPALRLLRDRIENWSDYDSFFVAVTESGWKASRILLYNIYLIAGTIIFITAALPVLFFCAIFAVIGGIGKAFAYPVYVINK